MTDKNTLQSHIIITFVLCCLLFPRDRLYRCSLLYVLNSKKVVRVKNTNTAITKNYLMKDTRMNAREFRSTQQQRVCQHCTNNIISSSVSDTQLRCEILLSSVPSTLNHFSLTFCSTLNFQRILAPQHPHPSPH